MCAHETSNLQAMKVPHSLLWYIACTTFLLSTVFGKKQRVQVKGRLFCGDKPASKVTVKLIERDLIKDDTLAKQETREDGSFHLDGTDDEIGTIEPELKVYHRCNSKHICKRRWIIKVPEKYIQLPSATESVFDIGAVNLEIHLKEDKKCLPV
ncbi:Mediator of RNA polymerase II transcription subun it 22 [Trichuris trichiura]|uniref:Mediator of RNA polymerase II transcription subun it 22 n=1 Tax=Trichuris trichiura TaxID=36087 RepID=A0A077ZPP8_TRITR|nr:Mediator of RNA polymerase II transcription subun it 22 [Trichuris trichiura]